MNITLPETIHADDDSMSVSLSSAGNIALIRQSFDRPPEVWAGPSDNLEQITHLNDAIQPAWGKAESIDYTNDGLPIQGWLLYPRAGLRQDAADGKKYPLIVSVHGGPSSAITPRWPTATYSATPFSALRLLRLPAQSARQLRPGRKIHSRPTSRTSAAAICATSSPASIG